MPQRRTRRDRKARNPLRHVTDASGGAGDASPAGPSRTDRAMDGLDRLFAFGGYAGFAPACYLWRGRLVRPFVKRHCEQALVLFLVLILIGLLFLVCAAVLSYAVVHKRELYEGTSLEGWLLTIFRWFVLAWLVFWAYGAGSALLGTFWELPGITFLAWRPRIVAAGAACQIATYVLVMVLAAVAARASSLARSDTGPAQVYLLYEDVDRYPRCLFTLTFYPAIRAGLDAFGNDSVAVLKLTRESLTTALEQGRFVFIGSHGKASGMLLDRQWFPPEEAAALPKGKHLSFVYLSGCDSGVQVDAWRAAFAPAEVVTHNRLTALIEHVWWLWFDAPGILRRLATEAEAARETAGSL